MILAEYLMDAIVDALQALEFSPEHAELLTTLGILYLRSAARVSS